MPLPAPYTRGVLILPPGHAETMRLRALSRRERRLIAGVLAVVAALVVGLVISFSSGGKSSAHGCIHLTIPAATGAQQIDSCGAQARSICGSTATPGAFVPTAARAIAAECRKAGVPTPGAPTG
jgi:hypothetical protein